MNEEDAQTAALQEYFDSNAPAGYGASFRAGWSAGRIYEVGVYTHGCEAMADQEITVWRDIAKASEQRERIVTDRLRLAEDQIREWEALAREKNWGYVYEEIGEALERQRQPENQPCGATDDGQACQWAASGPVHCETHGRTVFP